MKILLTPSDKDDPDYYVIRSYDKFSELTTDDLGQIVELRVDDMKLGLDCLFWIVDNYLCYLDKIKFTLMMPDWQECQDFKYFLKKYLYKLECSKSSPVKHGKKIQEFSNL